MRAFLIACVCVQVNVCVSVFLGACIFVCLILVSLFNGISTFVGYLMPKLFSKKNSRGTF